MSPSDLGRILALFHCPGEKTIPPQLTAGYEKVARRRQVMLNEPGGKISVPDTLMTADTDDLDDEQIDYFIGLFLTDHREADCVALATSLNDHYTWFSTYGTVLRYFIQGCGAGKSPKGK